MKNMNKAVDMLAWFDNEGNPNPVRFRTQTPSNENITIRIDKILNKQKSNQSGNYIIRFDCNVIVDEVHRNVQIMYEMGSCKWYLVKM